jgi:hypothetical protein
VLGSAGADAAGASTLGASTVGASTFTSTSFPVPPPLMLITPVNNSRITIAIIARTTATAVPAPFPPELTTVGPSAMTISYSQLSLVGNGTGGHLVPAPGYGP